MTTSLLKDWEWLFWPLLLVGALFLGMLISSDSMNKWDRATVIKVCRDGTKLFRMENGEYRVRSGIHSFHAEDPDVCAP